MSTFSIIEQLYPAPLPGTRYRLVETQKTIDGSRSRLTDRVSDDVDELRAMVWMLEEKGSNCD